MEQLHLLISDSYGLFSFQGTHPIGDIPSLAGHWWGLVALIKSASEQGFCDKSAGQRHFLGFLRGLKGDHWSQISGVKKRGVLNSHCFLRIFLIIDLRKKKFRINTASGEHSQVWWSLHQQTKEQEWQQ